MALEPARVDLLRFRRASDRHAGTALDGWAREELTLSMAWRAMGTDGAGGLTDSFDMAVRHFGARSLDCMLP